MGSMHLSAYADLADVNVVAFCPPDARSHAGNISIPESKLQAFDPAKIRKCADWQELIALPDLDAVDICLPTDLHPATAIAALEAGKHVLCEKPMALTAADCERMMDAAARSHRILMIGQVLRFWPEYRYLASFVKSGEHGAIRSATFVRRCGVPDWSAWLMDESRSGGAVVDLLVHDIDQALLLFGVPDHVAGKSIGDPDTIMATLIYRAGPEVRIQGGWFAPGTPLSMSFQVRAEQAELQWSAEGLMLSDAAGERKKIEPPPGDGYNAEIGYFVQCCRDNRQPDRCPPEDSARAVKLALLLRQSRAEGGTQIKCSV